MRMNLKMNEKEQASVINAMIDKIDIKNMMIEIEDFIGDKDLIMKCFKTIFLDLQNIPIDTLDSYYEFIVNFISNQFFHMKLSIKNKDNNYENSENILKNYIKLFSESKEKFIYSILLHIDSQDNK
jgi:hypothetical protein